MRTTMLVVWLVLLTGIPPTRAAAEPLEGRQISVDCHDTEIDDCLRIIAEAAGLNIVLIDAGNQRVTKKLLDRPWTQVLKAVLGEYGLQYRKDGDVLRVFSMSHPQGAIPVPPAAYTGRLASFDLNDQPAADVEKLLSAVAKQEVAIPRKDGCRISFRAYDIPWDQAADIASQICTRRRTPAP